MTTQAKIAKTLITLELIMQTIDSHPQQIDTIREILYKFVGAVLSFTGTVENKITRHEHLKLFMRPDLPDGKLMMIFAEFTKPSEAEKIHAAKIRKGSKVELTGKFCTVGYCAATMDYCRFKVK